MDFAVHVKGLDTEDKARWVLAVDPVGERLLITHDDRSLLWVAMADCKFVKCDSPDQPRLVMAVKPQQGPGVLSLPEVRLRPRGNHD